MARYLALALILIAAPVVYAANCGQFFAHHRQVAVVAAPVVAYPQVYYQAGQAIEVRAEVVKEVRAAVKAAVPAIVAELRGQLRWSPADAGQPQTAAGNVIAEYCGKCHSGANPKAGITYDGLAQLDCRHVTAALRQIASDEMPKDHKLTPELKGEVMQALLDLERTVDP